MAMQTKRGRPALGLEKKTRLNITVTMEERLLLDWISRQTGQSVSALVGSWAVKEAGRLARKTGKQPPEPEQLSF